MKKIYAIAIFTIMCIHISVVLQAQNFKELDINNSKDAHPFNYGFDTQPQYDAINGKFEYAVLNGTAYFTANDGIHGEELWSSDGTAQGTYMVKDINPYSSSYVRSITVSGDKIFFRANDGLYGEELWASDGTENGTYLVKDLSPFGWGSPTYLTDVNGILYFFINNFNVADQLWKTDGTPDGTLMVADFLSLFGAYEAAHLTNVNGRLFFVLNRNSDAELYTSDGTSPGTHLVKDINPFGGSYPGNLTAVRGMLYFAADDGNGRRLWKSNGTETGTEMPNNPNNIYVNDFYSLKFAIKNNIIYFSGNIPDGNGSRLCVYNTLNPNANVRALKHINPGFFSYNLYNITNVNGTLFFTVYNGIDQVLWKSDGTSAGTMQVKNIDPGGRNIYLYKNFLNANGTLLFSFYDDANGYEVWKSDGTGAGTVMVKEINKGVYSSQAANLTYIGNNISLFEATDGKKGLELWKTDGTEAGTALVKNINTSTSGSSDPYALTPTPDNSKLLFVATEPQYGTELRITDGTEEGTRVVKDLFKGSVGSSPFLLFNFKNETYFFANILDTADHTTSDVRTIPKLCKTDGIGAGTKILSMPALESFMKQTGYAVAVEPASDLFYLLLFNNATLQYELWRSDGTEAGTYAVKTDMPSFYTIFLKAVDNKLFFTNYDFTYGNELFVSDGSVAGTTLVKDITPGFNNSSLFNLTSFNGKLYFAADYGYGPFLWASDGTETGTKQVKPATLTYNSFAQANSKLFFSAVKNVGQGTELYANDGTSTYLVKDIYNGPGSSGIYNLTGGDTLIYFLANDGTHGIELWKSNGTKAGTRLVKDINPDLGDTYMQNMVTVHNKLFFTLYDILWESDGTKNGTHEVNDTNLAGATGLTFFMAFDNKISFAAAKGSSGRELYVGDAGGNTFAAGKAEDDNITKSNTAAFRARLYPNPTNSKATAEISGKFKDVSVTVSDMSGKIIWQGNYTNQPNINLPTEKLAAGMYIVAIKSGNENRTLKLVKE